MRRRGAILAILATVIAACGGKSAAPDGGVAATTASTAVAAPTTAPATTTTLPATYVLQAGDSPSAVADRFGVTVEELAAANLDNPDYARFLVGMEIRLPSAGPPPAPAAATTSPVTSLAAPAGVDGVVTLAFTGDIVAHRAVNRGAIQPDGTFDYHSMFDHLRPFISGFDLAICHMEQPIAPDENVIVEPPTLSIDASVTTAVAAAGYDRCSTASNHSLDRGADGIDATVAAFAAAGIGQSGMASSADTRLPALVTVNGVRIAHLSYTFSYNGYPPIPGEEWRSNLIDPNLVISDARAMRSGGAEAVIVSFHWGVERVVEPTSFQREVAEAVTASGEVDLIVGHHAHVLQPIEQVNGVWVVWGMGNVLSNHPTSSQWPASSQDAAVFTTALRRSADGSITVDRPAVYPTWCDTEGTGFLVRFTSEADDPAVPLSDATRAQLRISEQRTRDVLGDYMAV